MAATNNAGNDPYIFSTGDAAMARLRLLQSVFGPSTDLLLRDVGIAPGMHVADIGCGIGSVSCELARLVGDSGSVIGIDLSSAQLKIAASAAEEAGLRNIEFVEASATEIPYEAGDFDLVFCRLVLTHMPDPELAIREFQRVVRPGGKVACEELIGPQAFSSPTTLAYARLSAIVTEFGKDRGVDYAIGLRLPHLIKTAGFESPQARFVQPAYFSGEEKR
jgi:2-polyprenyl-3-methyl-5-hydroxy-6-metoxy-1,4-benzoquinol methylase